MPATAASAITLQADGTPERAGCAEARDGPLTVCRTRVERLRAAADQQQPIHQVEETSSCYLLKMGRPWLQASLALPGDSDVGPTSTIAGDRPSDPPQVVP
jgi:hypothetical protein